MRKALAITSVILIGVVVYVLLLNLAPVPPCQTMWNAHFTGTQTYHGHQIDCFYGQVRKIH